MKTLNVKNHFRRQAHVSQVWESTTMCATSWCADSTLIDHANEIRSHANMDTALVRLTCDSIDYRRLNCWSSQVLNVWIIAMTNIICYYIKSTAYSKKSPFCGNNPFIYLLEEPDPSRFFPFFEFDTISIIISSIYILHGLENSWLASFEIVVFEE